MYFLSQNYGIYISSSFWLRIHAGMKAMRNLIWIRKKNTHTPKVRYFENKIFVCFAIFHRVSSSLLIFPFHKSRFHFKHLLHCNLNCLINVHKLHYYQSLKKKYLHKYQDTKIWHFEIKCWVGVSVYRFFVNTIFDLELIFVEIPMLKIIWFIYNAVKKNNCGKCHEILKKWIATIQC